MAPLASYSLADFVPYSLEAWYRLVAGYNAELWPLQLLVALASAGLLVQVARRADRGAAARWAALGLACCWALIAWRFLYARFLPLDWIAAYLAAAFAAQALLLVAVGASRAGVAGAPVARGGGLALLAYAVLVHPWVEPLALGRPWPSVELFGIGPTPTAIGTLGWALTRSGWPRWLALPVPLGWCAFAGLSRMAIGG